MEDFFEAEAIIILGQNPGTNHPRMLSALQKAKQNGCTIISVNPLKETGLVGFNNPQKVNGVLGIKSQLTDIFLQVKINTNVNCFYSSVLVISIFQILFFSTTTVTAPWLMLALSLYALRRLNFK